MHSPTSSAAHRWWVLATVSLAQLMVVLDATVVNIAMPSAQADLDFADNDRQWVITAYALAFGSLLLLGGRLADLLGRRAMFLTGLIGFAAASALGGSAQSFTLLITARALQGVFAALLAPAALSILTTTFGDERERAKAFGVYGALTGAGGAIGLLLGGFLTGALSWRWTLFINVPFALIAAVGGVLLLRAGRGERRPLDALGTVFGGGGLFALVLGFSRAEPDGWGSARTWLPLAIASILLALFALSQRSAGDRALLPLPVILDRNRGAAFVTILANGAGMFGAFLFGTYYLQTILHYTPWQTGLAFLPQIVVLAAVAQLSSNVLLPRFGPKLVLPAGLAAAGIGMAMLARLDVDSGYASDGLPGLIALGIGLGLAMPASIQTATLGVDPRHSGVASAAVSTAQQVGAAIGIAALNSVATAASSNSVTDLPAASAAEALQHAQMAGYTAAFAWSAGIFLAGAILAALILRSSASSAGSVSPTSTDGDRSITADS